MFHKAFIFHKFFYTSLKREEEIGSNPTTRSIITKELNMVKPSHRFANHCTQIKLGIKIYYKEQYKNHTFSFSEKVFWIKTDE